MRKRNLQEEKFLILEGNIRNAVNLERSVRSPVKQNDTTAASNTVLDETQSTIHHPFSKCEYIWQVNQLKSF